MVNTLKILKILDRIINPEIIVLIYQEYYKVKNLRLEREEKKTIRRRTRAKKKLQNRIEEKRRSGQCLFLIC